MVNTILIFFVKKLQNQFPESLSLCAARIDALRSHGLKEAALKLAVAVVRTMKQQQLIAQKRWHESQQAVSSSSLKNQSNSSNEPSPCTSRCNGQGSCSTTSINAPANTDGWVGHPLDPIGTLFDTLADASLIPENQRYRSPSCLGIPIEEQNTNLRPLYCHTPVDGCRDRCETYLTLASEVALIGLGQQRLMPVGLYAQVCPSIFLYSKIIYEN